MIVVPLLLLVSVVLLVHGDIQVLVPLLGTELSQSV